MEPRPPASAAVVAHVEALILDGHAAPGDTLPSESELSAELGVSRLTVREGIRVLEARGLVEVSHGRRPIVARPNAQVLHDFFSAAVRRDVRGMLDLIEVRMAIEVHAAELAAVHATRTHLTVLDDALEAMRSAAADPAREAGFNAADLRFHAAIASASGVQMIDFLVEGMEQPLQRGRELSTQGHRRRSGDLSRLIEAHAGILAAIRDHDPARAAQRMRDHLEQTRADVHAGFRGGAAR